MVVRSQTGQQAWTIVGRGRVGAALADMGENDVWSYWLFYSHDLAGIV